MITENKRLKLSTAGHLCPVCWVFQQKDQGKLRPFIYMMARSQRVPEALASTMIRKS
jgi:hypothetical protein